MMHIALALVLVLVPAAGFLTIVYLDHHGRW